MLVLLLGEIDEEAVVPGVLPAEGLALARAAPHGLACHAAPVDQASDPLVAEHGDPAPQRGLVPCGGAPGAAHAVGGHQDVDVVQPMEDRQEHVRRQAVGPVPRLLARRFAPAARAAAAPELAGGGHAWRVGLFVGL